jgi:hypothetical protein
VRFEVSDESIELRRAAVVVSVGGTMVVDGELLKLEVRNKIGRLFEEL